MKEAKQSSNQTNKSKVPKSVSATFFGYNMWYLSLASDSWNWFLAYLCQSVVGDSNFMAGLSRKQVKNAESY